MSPSVSQLTAASTDLIANVFDALPLPAFIVDRDFNIIDFNLAGARLLDRVPGAVLRMRGCDRLQCTHSIETAEGAFAQACGDCIVKNFVREVFAEATASRSTKRLRLTSDGRVSDVDFLITVAPVVEDTEPLALLLLDNAEELSAVLQSTAGTPTPASSSPDSKARVKEPVRRMGSS